jgi:hypothetical protein
VNAKRVHEALKRINSAYVEGCIQFYDAFDKSEWQMAHDALEDALRSQNPVRIQNQITIFENTCLSLIRVFVRQRDKQMQRGTL